MMTETVAKVATAATARKVNLKAMMGKVTMSLTKNESLKNSPRNRVLIVKGGMCPRLPWLSAPDAFGTITFLFVPFVVTTNRLTANISKKPLPVVMTAVQLVTKT